MIARLILAALSRIGSLLEVHELRRDMKQATYTELIEWRESNLDAADIEADFERWAVEPAKEPQR